MNQTSIDLGQIARDLDLPLASVERTVALLDEGNTVPFITRYRKDHTGGLDEEQIRDIQSRVAKQRQLVERKQTILKSIEAQGKLTPDLAELIQSATAIKRLEDLYLPFKPKKQTLATVAREKGLEPLAREIFEADPAAADLNKRAEEFISAEKELLTVADVLQGVGHLMAERFSENAELRGRLRRIFQRSGKLVCTKVEAPPEAAPVMPAVASEGVKPEDASVAEAADEQLPTEGLVTSAAVPDDIVPTEDAATAPPAAALAGGVGRETTPESGALVPTDVAPASVETSAVLAATEQPDQPPFGTAEATEASPSLADQTPVVPSE
jgi:protein Tex